MASVLGEVLEWPAEVAVPLADDQVCLYSPGSNLVLDLHGDPTVAKLVVFSDGNHHMALADTCAAFVAEVPEVGDVFYATTPPRIISQALKSGKISTGNISLGLTPHVFISPGDVLEGLLQTGLAGPHKAIMRSSGLAILIAKGNPKKIIGPGDLLNQDVRMAISNPDTETASFTVYEAALCAYARREGRSENAVSNYLKSELVTKSTAIHHREIPDIISTGAADASLIYYHLALRYTRIFPDRFELIEIDSASLPDPERFITTYHIALVGSGGAYGARFVQFFGSDPVASIYRSHGLQPSGDV